MLYFVWSHCLEGERGVCAVEVESSLPRLESMRETVVGRELQSGEGFGPP